MDKQVYADDIGAISVSGTIIRFDLMTASVPEENSGTKPRLEVQQRVIMSIDGFLRAAAKIQGVVADMEKRGMITRGAQDSAKAVQKAQSSEPRAR